MNLLEIGKKIGELEGLIRNIDEGTLVTKKNNINSRIKYSSLKIINEIEEYLK